MKAVKTALKEAGNSDEEVKEFETGASKFVKETLLPNFKDFEFYTGESMNPDGQVALLNYREDGVTPVSITRYPSSRLRPYGYLGILDGPVQEQDLGCVPLNHLSQAQLLSCCSY